MLCISPKCILVPPIIQRTVLVCAVLSNRDTEDQSEAGCYCSDADLKLLLEVDPHPPSRSLTKFGPMNTAPVGTEELKTVDSGDTTCGPGKK